MRVLVKAKFFDQQEQKDRRVGEVFECSNARFADIEAKLPGWLEKVEEPKKATATTASTIKSSATKRK